MPSSKNLYIFLKIAVYFLIWIGVLLVFLNLGRWQYNKGLHQFMVFKNLQIVQESKTPLSFQNGEGKEGQLLETYGYFSETPVFLINGARFKERLGYEVVSLWNDRSGHRYWVNRGWIARNQDRTWQPFLTHSVNQRLLFFLEKRSETNSQPRSEVFNRQIILPFVNTHWLNALSHQVVSTRVLFQALGNQKNILRRDIKNVLQFSRKQKFKHYAYTGQWWLMGCGWLIFGIYRLRRYAIKK